MNYRNFLSQILLPLFFSVGANAETSAARSYLEEILKPVEVLNVEGRVMSIDSKATQLGDMKFWVDFKGKRLRAEHHSLKKTGSFAVFLSNESFLEAEEKPFKFKAMELKDKAVASVFAQLLFALNSPKDWKTVLTDNLFKWTTFYKDSKQTIELLPIAEGLLFKKITLIFSQNKKLTRLVTELSDGTIEELYVTKFEAIKSDAFPAI